MTSRWLLIAVLLFACGQSGEMGPKIPQQDELVNFIWNQVYKRNDSPPKIVWVFQKDLNCENNIGFLVKIHPELPLMCVAGVYYHSHDTAFVAYPDGRTKALLSTQHELNHARLYREFGDSDPTHSDKSWGVEYGNLPSLLDYANFGVAIYF